MNDQVGTGRELAAIDLCCGAGGWAAAARGLPIRWRAVVDIAADCLETWRQNHAEDHPGCRIMPLDLSEPEGIDQIVALGNGVDLIVGGIPCAEISPARGSIPVAPEQMQRWWDLLDGCLAIVDRLCPPWWCFEDVIGIEKHLPLPVCHGKAIPLRRINAAEFGPQSRLRTYLGVFPEPKGGKGSLRDCLLEGPHLTVADAEKLQPNPDNRNRVFKDFARILSPSDPCPTITGSFSCRGGRQKRTWIVEDHRGRRRQLSWQEAALVQGFPRDYLFAGAVGRTCEMIGQAIPVQVGRAILKAILEHRRE